MQNELILDILSTDLRRTICIEIRNSIFFQLDSTRNITKEVIYHTKVNHEQKQIVGNKRIVSY